MDSINKSAALKTPFSNVIDKYDNFLFDCDGVLYNSTIYLQETFTALNKLKELNKGVYFITNNSRCTRKEISDRISAGGFQPDLDKIYTSAYLTAQYFTLNYPDIKKVYVIGVSGLKAELEEAGLTVVGVEQDNNKEMNVALFDTMKVEEDIQAVVVGLDYEFNFYKLCYASILVQKGVPLIATNLDGNALMKRYKMPGGGVFVKMIEHACGVKSILCGKPDRIVIDIITKSFGLDPAKCLMTGDRLDSDVLLGKNAGIDTYLVLSGVTSEEELMEEKKKEDSVIPDYYWSRVEL